MFLWSVDMQVPIIHACALALATKMYSKRDAFKHFIFETLN